MNTDSLHALHERLRQMRGGELERLAEQIGVSRASIYAYRKSLEALKGARAETAAQLERMLFAKEG